MSDSTNQAIERLASALYELSSRGGYSIKPAIRMLLSPGQPVPEDVRHLHAFGMSPQIADVLAEAIEQLLIRIDTVQLGERPDPSGAALFAEAHPDLAGDLTDAFNDLDLTALVRTVLNDTDPCDRKTVTRALDAMFGDCATEDEEENGDHR